MPEFKYKPDGDVLKSFMKNPTFFRGIRGPVGSGKSVGCCVEVFRRALEQEKGADGIRHSRWAIIRNTNPQLRLIGVSLLGRFRILTTVKRVTLILRFCY